jgi:hypothetical protein
MVNDTACAITMYNQHKDMDIIVEGKKISGHTLFLGAIDLGTGTNGLMYAVHHENMSLINLFLEGQEKVNHECNYQLVNYQNYTGCTALHIAARKGNKEIVALLLQHGANPRSC